MTQSVSVESVLMYISGRISVNKGRGWRWEPYQLHFRVRWEEGGGGGRGGRWLLGWVVLGPAEAGHSESEQVWVWGDDCSFGHLNLEFYLYVALIHVGLCLGVEMGLALED